MDIIARGENKVSFRMRGGMQVDVRLLSPDSFGAAMQYFTGSKAHNVALRQRALKMGYTLSEYSLAQLDNEKAVAGKSEEEIYAKLKLDYIPPELRENLGEIDAAEKHTLPALISQADLQGDVHMHTVETDGRNTIEEMAEAARAHGYNTWPSPTIPRTWPSPTASTTSARSSTSNASAPPTNKIGRHQNLRRNRSRHSGRRHARSLRLRARTNGSRHRQRPLPLQPKSQPR